MLLPPATSFFPNIRSLLAAPGSVTHQHLMEEAALNVTLQLFPEQPPSEQPPVRLEDFLDFLPTSGNDPELHFDAERLGQGRMLLAGAPRAAMGAARALEHTLAHQRLGAALHALRDFDSHSNWVDLGRQQPHPQLLWLRQELGSLARAALGICWALHSSLLATLELIPPNLQSPEKPPGRQGLLDISPASSLSFVLDTTGSTGEEINAAKIQARHIVEQRRGCPMEPVHYVLVPFQDPGFGPVFTTSDPDSFWQQLNEIHALGVEMSLTCACQPWSAPPLCQPVLLHTPPLSDSFVFTDASPKDAMLASQVESLTQEWHCRVTFLVTEDPSRVQGRARREVLSPLCFEPYEAVALTSGGEVIFTKDQHIQDVAAIVGDSMADVVTLPLEPPVVSGRPLVFRVDMLLQRVTVQIHREVYFPVCVSRRREEGRRMKGVSQGQEEGEGPLGHTRRFGQFCIVTVNDPPQTGTWEIWVTAEDAPRVRGQGLQSQLLVEVTGLGSRGNPGDARPHFSHVVLRGVPEGAERGWVPLEPTGPRQRGVLVASLPPVLLSTGDASLWSWSAGRRGAGPAPSGTPSPAPWSRCFGRGRCGWGPERGAAAPALTRPPPCSAAASFSGPQDLDLRPSVSPSFPLTSNPSVVRLEPNESAWGRLWLEVPDSAAPDSLVTVTVTSTGREASPVPPTHAFLQLLVLGPARRTAGRPCPLIWPYPRLNQPCLHFGDSGKGRGRAGGQPLVGHSWRGDN
ncbi:hypothetical protein GH733_016584, partial [Mirounga leonina]